MRGFSLLLAFLACIPHRLDAQFGEPGNSGELTPPGILHAAIQNEGKYQFSIARQLLLTIEDQADSIPDILWHLGVCNAELGDHKRALGYFLAYQAKVPDDWTVLPMLIQSYQGIERFSERDDVRATLLTRRVQRANRKLVEASDFRREIVVVDSVRMYAYESFIATGPRHALYRFVVVDSSGGQRGTFTLVGDSRGGSPPGEIGQTSSLRPVYYLDFVRDDFHATYAHFSFDVPTYEQTRDTVIVVLQGNAKPISSYVRKDPSVGKSKLRDRRHELDAGHD